MPPEKKAAKRQKPSGGGKVTTSEAKSATDESESLQAVSIQDFLNVVFAKRNGDIWVTEFAGDPHAKGKKVDWQWAGRSYDGQMTFDVSKNLYFAISEVKPGSTRRQVKTFQALVVVALDDIGTKVDPTKITLPPTYRIQSSLGNEQWGFVLDMPLTNPTKANRLLEALKHLGATDKGGMNIVRYMRLPGGINGHRGDHPVRLVEWHPELRYSVDELCRAFGIELEGKPGAPQKKLPPLSAADDPMLVLFERVSNTPNDRGFIDVVCPWADQHSDPKANTAGYYVGGAFHCFHGSCADKTILDVIVAFKGAGKNVEQAVAAMPGPHGGLLRALQRYVFAGDIDQFIDREFLLYLKVDAFNRWTANQMRGYQMAKFLLERDDLVRVAATAYVPGQPELLTLNQFGRPMRAVNMWRPGPILPAAMEHYDPTLIQPWLDHLEWLLSVKEERQIMHDFLAHIVQRRGAKINWLLIALSIFEGAGRDTLIEPVRDILGVRNVNTITTDVLFSQFNAWELCELVCFDEADTDDNNRWNIYKVLKPKVVRPPNTRAINEKNVRLREMDKMANYIMFTNSMAALGFDKGARRVCVVETMRSDDEIKAYAATGKFKDLHALYAKPDWLAQFYRYLLEYQISDGFDALGRAPETAASQRMAQANMTELDIMVRNEIDKQTKLDPVKRGGSYKHDLIQLVDVVNELKINTSIKCTYGQMASALRRAGAVQIPEFRNKHEKKMRGVWAVRDTEKYLLMNAAKMKEIWGER